MRIAIYDIETSGLALESSIYVLGIKEVDGETKAYTAHYTPNSDGSISLAKKVYSEYDLVVGLNNVGFDAKILFSQWHIKPNQLDLLLLSKLMYTSDELYDIDRGIQDMPSDLWGRYSLKAWGYRFDDNKLEFEDWSRLTERMVTYCKQDIDLTYKLYQYLINDKERYPLQSVINLEHEVADIVADQTRFGFMFDIEFMLKKMAIEANLHKVFKPKFLPDGKVKETKGYTRKEWLLNTEYEPDWLFLKPYISKLEKYKNGKFKFKKKLHWSVNPERLIIKKTSGEYQNIKLTRFNPGSRAHIKKWLIDLYGWEPIVFTKTGNAKVDYNTLLKL